MNLSVGIIGLPNAGKSTLFNALLQRQVAAVAAYPFCTIEPNKGVVAVPDERLAVLAKIGGAAKIVPAVVEFIDIAGLVKGAAQGEGLGNKFLAHIREVALIVHVVRFFENDSVAHVERQIDPKADVAIINHELILADLETLEKQKKPDQAIQFLEGQMNQGKPAREAAVKTNLPLLTAKPVVYVANADEEQLKNADRIKRDFPYKPVVVLSAKAERGIDQLIKTAYTSLGLISFLTVNQKEARAWTIKKGTTAKEAAAVVHTDFAKGFIKADVISYQEFVRWGGWQKARAAGKVRSQGTDYQLGEGEVVDFKFN